MSTPRSDFLSGVRDVSPILLGNVPFGMLAGATAVSVGIPALQAFAMSVFVFAGAAQLAAIGLIGSHSPAAIVVVTALIINLRYVMYSASIAPHFRRLPTKLKWAFSYFLLDANYALSILEFDEHEATSRRWYYLGTSLPIWAVWQASTLAGILLGATVPPSWQLDFAVPLLFLALLVPTLRDRASKAAALAAGVVAMAADSVPFHLGLAVAAFVGIVVGLLVQEAS